MTNSNRRLKLRWLALAAILFFAWFLWQLFGPTPPIIVSKETTYITAPLSPDGLPDYRQSLDNRLRAGVTQENNAAVLMWQAFGPGVKEDAIDAAEWQQIVSELQLSPPASNKYLVDPFEVANVNLVGDWLYARNPEWKRAVSATTNQGDDGLLDAETLGYEAIGQAMDAPWRSSDLPPLAAWIRENNSLIEILVEGSQRSRLYTPLPPEKRDDEAPLADIPLNNIQRLRAIARVLVTRAMFHLGEGRFEEAWRDLHAIHRWARLTAQGPYIVDQLVAAAIEAIAFSADAVLLASDNLPLELAQKIQRDLDGLPPAANLACILDHGERLYFVDSIIHSRNQGIGNFVAENFQFDHEAGEPKTPDRSNKLLNFVRADWNVGLEEGNRYYDRFAAAARLPNYGNRKREFRQLDGEISQRASSLRKPTHWVAATFNPGKRNEMLASAILSAFSPAFSATPEALDRSAATLDLTQLAAALTVYRAKYGSYPDRLDQLIPDMIPELPTDSFHNKPFNYHRDADGYLLYTCGPNGSDDGGSGQFSNKLAGRPIDSLPESEQAAAQEQIPAGADDISIRVPTPPFKLPTPPPNP